MKLKGKIDLLFDRDRGLEISIRDKISGTNFLDVSVSSSDVLALLSRKIRIDCDLEVNDIEKVGKRQWLGTLEFMIPDYFKDLPHKEIKQQLLEVSRFYIDDPWVSDGYFNSKDSRFLKDGIEWARTTIRAYLPDGEQPPTEYDLPDGVVIDNIRCPSKDRL